MEVVSSSAEYAAELTKLTEEFTRFRWSNASAILAVLLKETGTKDHFLQVSRRLCKALRWFSVNRASLESMNASLKKRSVHSELTDKLSAMLSCTSVGAAGSTPSLHSISEVLTIKDLSDQMKKTVIEGEWESALRSIHAFLVANSPHATAAAATAACIKRGAILKTALLKVKKLCGDDNWDIALFQNGSARQAVVSICDDLCTLISVGEKEGNKDSAFVVTDDIWTLTSTVFACSAALRKDM